MDGLHSQHDLDIISSFHSRYSDYDPFEHENNLSEPVGTVGIDGTTNPRLDYTCSPIILTDLDVLTNQNILLEAIEQNAPTMTLVQNVYFFHGDHLGSANWITDADGNPIQYIHYAPYGELIANQQTIGYDERFKFTGKERDAETGYDYFGARFYWSVDGIFTTVDPLADKYPGNTPYLYCGGNPIMLVDPDGRDVKKFLRGLQRNITANMSLSIGLQLGLKFNLAKKLDVEAEMNFGSYQIDNEHDIANPAWKVGAGLMVENFGLKVTETVSDRENKTATKEQNIQIGAGIANIDITTTTNYNETKRGGYEHYVQVGKENTEVTMEQTLISENLEIDAGVSALIGLEISINVNVIQMINDLLD